MGRESGGLESGGLESGGPESGGLESGGLESVGRESGSLGSQLFGSRLLARVKRVEQIAWLRRRAMAGMSAKRSLSAPSPGPAVQCPQDASAPAW